MTLDNLWSYLRGYVRIRVTGPAVERFVNLAVSRGHRLWQTRRSGRSLEANVEARSFRRLRRAARRTRSRVRILERHGLPFLLARTRRRPFLVLGAAVCLVALYAFSLVIWVVDVEGTAELDPELILEVAASLGLRPGVLRGSVNPREVERGLILAVNGLSWAAVELHGATALIRVIEKVPLEKPVVPAPPADIVAAKDGVIQSLIVLAGQPVVKEGDTVKAGQVLISGGTDTVARGIAKSRVWYQAYAEVRLHSLVHEPTGRWWRHVVVRLGDRVTLPLWGWWSQPRGLYERREERREVPWWRSGPWPVEVEIVTTVYTQVRDVRRDVTPEEAEAMARDAAVAALKDLLPEGSEPVVYDFEVTVKNDILIGVLATAETLEDIAQTRERR